MNKESKHCKHNFKLSIKYPGYLTICSVIITCYIVAKRYVLTYYVIAAYYAKQNVM